MKIAKTLAILVGLVLVVVCFNAPFVLSEEGDGHPWDGEGGNGGKDNGLGESDSSAVINPLIPSVDSGTNNPGIGDIFNLEGIVSTFQFIFWYHDVPNVSSGSNEMRK